MTQAGSQARRYRVLDILGRGRSGTVYRAECIGAQGTKREVALKILSTDFSARPGLLDHLRTEAEILRRLDHPGLVANREVVRLDGRWCAVMDHVRGVNLAHMLRATGGFPASIVLKVMWEVADAIDEAGRATDAQGQRAALIHGSLKPSNVHLTARGDVRVLDLGLARLGRGEASPYAPPEWPRTPHTGPGDVFSLTMTLIELLTGSLPPGGVTTETEHKERRTEIWRTLAKAKVRKPIREMIRYGAAFDPEIRPTARQIARACEALLVGEPDHDVAHWGGRRVAALLKRQRLKAGPHSHEVWTDAPEESIELDDFEDERATDPALRPSAGTAALEPAPPIDEDDDHHHPTEIVPAQRRPTERVPIQQQRTDLLRIQEQRTQRITAQQRATDKLRAEQLAVTKPPARYRDRAGPSGFTEPTPLPRHPPVPREAPAEPEVPKVRLWFVGSVGGFVGVGIVTVAAVVGGIWQLSGGTGLLPAILWDVVTDPAAACMSHVKFGRKIVVEHRVKPNGDSLEVIEDLEQQCLGGAIDFWGSAMVFNEFHVRTADRRLSPADRAAVEREIQRWSQ